MTTAIIIIVDDDKYNQVGLQILIKSNETLTVIKKYSILKKKIVIY